MRSIWKGHIRFSLVMIPIRIYSAIDTVQGISFNQLHKDCNGRIGYDKKCKKCQESVPTEDILKGYEYAPEQYVIIEKEDLEKIRLKSTKVIEIEAFVNASEVQPTLYETPYFAGPENEIAAKSYALLRDALKETGKVGIGKVVLRDREEVVLIAPQEEGIILYKLRYPKELRSIKDVPQLGDKLKIEPEQLKLARHLLETMSASFAETTLTDTYNEALREIIQAKIEGKEVVAYEEPVRPVVDIMTALKQSIDEAKTRRPPMVKATGKEKAEETKPVPVKVAKIKEQKRKRA
jgi:DNA end-binding protein Ku